MSTILVVISLTIAVSNAQDFCVGAPRVDYANAFEFNPLGSDSQPMVAASYSRVYRVGEFLKYQCYDGFQLVREEGVITCLARGEWSENPVCTVSQYDCSKPPTINNGFCFQEQNSSIYRCICNFGFDMSGESITTCDSNYGFSSVPLCQSGDMMTTEIPGCEQLETIEGALCRRYLGPSNRQPWIIVNSRFSQGLSLGDIFECKCQDGFVLASIRTELLKCQENGSWTGKPVCSSSIACQPLQIENGFSYEVINGFITKMTNMIAIPTGNSVIVDCYQRYQLYGPSSMTCLSDGTWSSAPPRCLPEPTQPVTLPPTTRPTTTTTMMATRAETASAYCVHHTIPNGRLTQLRYSGISNGYLVEAGNTFQVDCGEGFSLKGSNVITCQTNGYWSDYPVCQREEHAPMICTETPQIENGYCGRQPAAYFSPFFNFFPNFLQRPPMVFTYGDSCSCYCNDGCVMVTQEPYIECLGQNRWSGPAPRCVSQYDYCRYYNPSSNMCWNK